MVPSPVKSKSCYWLEFVCFSFVVAKWGLESLWGKWVPVVAWSVAWRPLTSSVVIALQPALVICYSLLEI